MPRPKHDSPHNNAVAAIAIAILAIGIAAVLWIVADLEAEPDAEPPATPAPAVAE